MMADRRSRTSDTRRRSVRDEPEIVRPQEIPRAQSTFEQPYATNHELSSSSSSSSYIDISRAFPERRPRGFGAIRTFFTAPSERRRIKRRRSKRLLRLSNSSSSSVNSDLAYGTGFIKKKKGDRRQSSVGLRREYGISRTSLDGRSSRNDGRNSRNDGRASRTDGRASRNGRASAAGRATPSMATDAAILTMGAELAALARRQNRQDLGDVRRPGLYPVKRLSTGLTRDTDASRGFGSSKPSPGVLDEDGWESASDAGSDSSSVDSNLAFGHEVGHEWERENKRPIPRRKSTVVDPTLFGPANSLHGIVYQPVGFQEVKVDLSVNPPTLADLDSQRRSSYRQEPERRDSRRDESVASSPRSLQHVFPIPTSDPSRFDVGRASEVTTQQERHPGGRPGPVTIQQPQPVAPVSQRVFEPIYSIQSENESRSKASSFGKSSSIAGAALAGVAATAIGAAIVADRRDDRKEKRREESRDSDRKKRRRDSGRDDDRKSDMQSVITTDSKDDDRERRRERRREDKERYPDETREQRKERRRREDREAEERQRRPGKGSEAPYEETRSSALVRRDSRGYEIVEGRRDDRSKNGIAGRSVDPFQFQVADDAFATPQDSRTPEPVEVVTVDREPSYIRRRSSSLRDSQSQDDYSDPRYYHEASVRTAGEAKSMYDEIEHFTAPIEMGAIGAAVAAVTAEESRNVRRASRDRNERRKAYGAPSEEERDLVQEEADRVYREAVLARQMASEEVKVDDGVVRIVTPPGYHEEHKGKGPYDAPNADFDLDRVMTPVEFKGFTPFADRRKSSEQNVKSVQPTKEDFPLARPLLTLVQPTPAPTPTPEKQRERSGSRSSSKRSSREQSRNRESDATRTFSDPDVTIGPRGNVIVQSSSTPPTPKGVTWGENQMKHYDVESPSETKEEFIDIKPKSQEQEKHIDSPPGSSGSKKSSGWGMIAGAIAGVGAAETAEEVRESRKERNPQDASVKGPFEYRGVVVEHEPDSPPRTVTRDFARDPVRSSSKEYTRDSSPPAVGPKPTSPSPNSRTPHMPGAFDDDLDFTATLAAGLQDSGFDPNIVIEDPTYRRRDSPPGSGGLYQAPYAETISDVGSIHNRPFEDESTSRGQDFTLADLPDPSRKEAAIEDDFTPKLSKKEQKKRDKAAKRQSMDAETPVEVTPIIGALVEEPESYFEPPTSKKDKKKSKKSKRESYYNEPEEDTQKVTVPINAFDDLRQVEIAPEVAAIDEWESSKKKKKSKRDSVVYDSPPQSDPADVPLPAASEGSQYGDWEEPTSKKKKSKRDSGRYDSPSRSDPADVPLPAASEVSRYDDWDDVPSKKKSKRDGSRHESPSRSVPADIPLPTTSEVSRYDDYQESPSSKKKSSRRDSSRHDSPSRSVSADPEPVAASSSSRYNDEDDITSKKKKSKRSSSRHDSPSRYDPTDVPLPAASEVSRYDDYQESSVSKRRSSKRDSDRYDSPSREPADYPLPTASEVSRSDYEEPRKSRKSSKRDGTASERSQSVMSRSSAKSSRYGDDDDDDRKSKKRDKEKEKEKEKTEKKGGFFGLFSSKSEVSKSESSRSRDSKEKSSHSKDDLDLEDSKKKSKKSKRSSIADSSDLYGDFGSQSVADISQIGKESNGHDHDDDEHSRRRKRSSSRSSTNGHRSRRSDEENGTSKEESFLGKAGTLGVGAGLAGAAVAMAVQHQQRNADVAEDSQQRSIGKVSEDSSTSREPETPIRLSRSYSEKELFDPEISEREFRPSIDPQYGDLLPLPPSIPGSPKAIVDDELPSLPASRPTSPMEEEQRRRERPTVSTRKADLSTPVKSPSQSAIPLKFMMGRGPASPSLVRSSPIAASTLESPDTAQRPRSRPTSWDAMPRTKGFQPLFLLDKTRRDSSSQPENQQDLFTKKVEASQTSSDDTALHQMSSGAIKEHDHRRNKSEVGNTISIGMGTSASDAFAGISQEKQKSLEDPSQVFGFEPSPVQSDTKDRSSYLFQPTPPHAGPREASQNDEVTSPTPARNNEEGLDEPQDIKLQRANTLDALESKPPISLDEQVNEPSQDHEVEQVEEFPIMKSKKDKKKDKKNKKSRSLTNDVDVSAMLGEPYPPIVEAPIDISAPVDDASRTIPEPPHGELNERLDDKYIVPEDDLFTTKSSKKDKMKKKGKSLSSSSTNNKSLSAADDTTLESNKDSVSDIPLAIVAGGLVAAGGIVAVLHSEEQTGGTSQDYNTRSLVASSNVDEPLPETSEGAAVEDNDDFFLIKLSKKDKKKKARPTSMFDEIPAVETPPETALGSDDTVTDIPVTVDDLRRRLSGQEEPPSEDFFSVKKSKKDKKKNKSIQPWDIKEPVLVDSLETQSHQAPAVFDESEVTAKATVLPQEELFEEPTKKSKKDKKKKKSLQSWDDDVPTLEQARAKAGDATTTLQAADDSPDVNAEESLVQSDKVDLISTPPSAESEERSMPIVAEIEKPDQPNTSAAFDAPLDEDFSTVRKSKKDKKKKRASMVWEDEAPSAEPDVESVDAGEKSLDNDLVEIPALHNQPESEGIDSEPTHVKDEEFLPSKKSKKDKKKKRLSVTWEDEQTPPAETFAEPEIDSTHAIVTLPNLEVSESPVRAVSPTEETQPEASQPSPSIDEVAPEDTFSLKKSKKDKKKKRNSAAWEEEIVSPKEELIVEPQQADFSYDTDTPITNTEQAATEIHAQEVPTDPVVPIDDTEELFSLKKSKKDKKKKRASVSWEDEVPMSTPPADPISDTVLEAQPTDVSRELEVSGTEPILPAVSSSIDHNTSEEPEEPLELPIGKKSKKDKKKKKNVAIPWEDQQAIPDSAVEVNDSVDVETSPPEPSSTSFVRGPIETSEQNEVAKEQPLSSTSVEEPSGDFFAVKKPKKDKKKKKASEVSWEEEIAPVDPPEDPESHTDIDKQAPVSVDTTLPDSLTDLAASATTGEEQIPILTEEPANDNFSVKTSKKDKKKKKGETMSWEDEPQTLSPPLTQLIPETVAEQTSKLDSALSEKATALLHTESPTEVIHDTPTSTLEAEADKKDPTSFSWDDIDALTSASPSIGKDSVPSAELTKEALPEDEWSAPPSSKKKKKDKRKSSSSAYLEPQDLKPEVAIAENEAFPDESIALTPLEQGMSGSEPVEDWSVPASLSKKAKKEKKRNSIAWEEPPDHSIIEPPSETRLGGSDSETQRQQFSENRLVVVDAEQDTNLYTSTISEEAAAAQPPVDWIEPSTSKKNKKKGKKTTVVWDEEPDETTGASTPIVDDQIMNTKDGSPTINPTSDEPVIINPDSDTFEAPKSKKDRKKKKTSSAEWDTEESAPIMLDNLPSSEDTMKSTLDEPEPSVQPVVATVKEHVDSIQPKPSKKDKKKNKNSLKWTDNEPEMSEPVVNDDKAEETVITDSPPTIVDEIPDPIDEWTPTASSKKSKKKGKKTAKTWDEDETTTTAPLPLEDISNAGEALKSHINDFQHSKEVSEAPGQELHDLAKQPEDVTKGVEDSETPRHVVSEISHSPVAFSVDPTPLETFESARSDFSNNEYFPSAATLHSSKSTSPVKDVPESRGYFPSAAALLPIAAIGAALGLGSKSKSGVDSKSSEDIAAKEIKQDSLVAQEATVDEKVDPDYYPSATNLHAPLSPFKTNHTPSAAASAHIVAVPDSPQEVDLARLKTEPPTVSKLPPGVSEEQLELARQMKMDFENAAKKGKKGKKSRLSRSTTDDDFSPRASSQDPVDREVSQPPLPEGGLGRGNLDSGSPGPDGLNAGYKAEQLELARQLKEEFSLAGTKKSKKGKKNRSSSQTPIEGEASSYFDRQTEVEEPSEPTTESSIRASMSEPRDGFDAGYKAEQLELARQMKEEFAAASLKKGKKGKKSRGSSQAPPEYDSTSYNDDTPQDITDRPQDTGSEQAPLEITKAETVDGFNAGYNVEQLELAKKVREEFAAASMKKSKKDKKRGSLLRTMTDDGYNASASDEPSQPASDLDDKSVPLSEEQEDFAFPTKQSKKDKKQKSKGISKAMVEDKSNVPDSKILADEPVASTSPALEGTDAKHSTKETNEDNKTTSRSVADEESSYRDIADSYVPEAVESLEVDPKEADRNTGVKISKKDKKKGKSQGHVTLLADELEPGPVAPSEEADDFDFSSKKSKKDKKKKAGLLQSTTPPDQESAKEPVAETGINNGQMAPGPLDTVPAFETPSANESTIPFIDPEFPSVDRDMNSSSAEPAFTAKPSKKDKKRGKGKVGALASFFNSGSTSEKPLSWADEVEAEDESQESSKQIDHEVATTHGESDSTDRKLGTKTDPAIAAVTTAASKAGFRSEGDIDPRSTSPPHAKRQHSMDVPATTKKSKKDRKKKIVDRRTSQGDDLFDDPALWEGADPLAFEDPKEEHPVPSIGVMEQNSNDKSVATEMQSTPSSATEQREDAPHASSTGAFFATHNSSNIEQPMTPSKQILTKTMSQDDLNAREARYSTPTPLPVVIEEDSPTHHAGNYLSSKRDLEAPNRDSGFVTDSPTMAPRELVRTSENRDSGVHMREWSPAPSEQTRRIKSPHDEALGRLTWPKVDEQSETVDLSRSEQSQLPQTPRYQANAALPLTGAAAAGAGLVAAGLRSHKNSPDAEHVHTKITPEHLRLNTPDLARHRPTSANSLRSSGSVTPPLRRSDRKLSGDLRSLSQRSGSNLAKDAKEAERNTSATPSLTESNPIANEGRARAKEMADVYVSNFC